MVALQGAAELAARYEKQAASWVLPVVPYQLQLLLLVVRPWAV
jgi:hypothetical protein